MCNGFERINASTVKRIRMVMGIAFEIVTIKEKNGALKKKESINTWFYSDFDDSNIEESSIIGKPGAIEKLIQFHASPDCENFELLMDVTVIREKKGELFLRLNKTIGKVPLDRNPLRLEAYRGDNEN